VFRGRSDFNRAMFHSLTTVTVNDDEKKVVAGLVDVLDQFEEMRPNQTC